MAAGSGPQRARYARELADAIEERAGDFAVLDAIDSGAPVTEMRSEAGFAAGKIAAVAGLDMLPLGRERIRREPVPGRPDQAWSWGGRREPIR